ncbi:hypothetical protein CR513_47023, partial [Mucuna pruriens]
MGYKARGKTQNRFRVVAPKSTTCIDTDTNLLLKQLEGASVDGICLRCEVECSSLSSNFLCSLLFILKFKMQTNFISLLLLLIIFLCFSHILSASAIPATRTQNLKGEEDSSSLPSLARMDDAVGNGEGVVVDTEEGFIARRVDLETQDYEGTGANTDHDPKSPGGA